MATVTRTKVYATQPIALDHDFVFAIGDELHWHFSPERLAALIELGHASEDRPAGGTPAYATLEITYRPHWAGVKFKPGDRVDGAVPAPLLAQWLADGRASYAEPEVSS